MITAGIDILNQFEVLNTSNMSNILSSIKLAPNPSRFESCQGLWTLSCEEVIQLAYGTSVILLNCLLVPHEVFLHQ